MGVSDTAGPALMSEPTGVEGHGRTGHLPRFCCAQLGNGPRHVLRLDTPPDCIASQQHLVEHLRLAETVYTGLVRMARQRRRVAVAAGREIPYPVREIRSERDSNPRWAFPPIPHFQVSGRGCTNGHRRASRIQNPIGEGITRRAKAPALGPLLGYARTLPA